MEDRTEYLRNLASGNITGYHETMRDNVLRLFRTAHRAEKERGLVWYRRAHDWANATGTEYNLSTLTVAHVISALSPMNVWEENLRDTLRLLERVDSNDGPIGLSVCTFHRQKKKAWHIATYESMKFQSGNKTECFAVNIGRPWEDGPVTIDRHARDAALGATEGGGKVSMTNLRYRKIADAYRAARDVLKEEGWPDIRAHQVQAVVWVTWRRRHGANKRFIRRNGQPELFPSPRG
jgi:hypothetical protein